MRVYDSATLAALQTGRAFEARRLIRVTARDRDTGDPEVLRLWEGAGDISIDFGGGAETFVGQTVVDIEPIQSALGVDVQSLQARLAPLDETVRAAVGFYDARLAPVQIWRALFDPSSGVLIGPPTRIFRGWIDQVAPSAGRQPALVVTMASAAMALTRTGPWMKSQADLHDYAGDEDRFRENADISGEVTVAWGGQPMQSGGNTGSGGSTSIWKSR